MTTPRRFDAVGRDIDRRILPIYRMWNQCDTALLCRETHREAVKGTCPTHGGDACLHQYVQVSELQRAHAIWAREAFDAALGLLGGDE